MGTPFGTSFLIWSVIFMWQLFWVIWQFLPSQRNCEGVIRAWYYYPLFTVFQAGWTFSFAHEIMWLSLIFMYGILVTLVSASMSLAVLIITAFTWLSSYPCDFAIPCVIVWALCGVYAELNLPLPLISTTFSERQINGIQTSVLSAIVLIAVGILSKALYILIKQRPEELKQEGKNIVSKSEAEEVEESV